MFWPCVKALKLRKKKNGRYGKLWEKIKRVTTARKERWYKIGWNIICGGSRKICLGQEEIQRKCLGPGEPSSKMIQGFIDALLFSVRASMYAYV